MLYRMNRFLLCSLMTTFCTTALAANRPSDNAKSEASPAELQLAEYFRAETGRLAGRCLAEIHTLEDWKGRQAEYRRQLREMLGLDPWPERTDLKPVITGTVEGEGFTVENLHFQASPGLYVTANFYRPKLIEKRLPAILYVCGHSRVVTNDVSYGNKTGYQHHGAWFARNGYVCLTIDTVQLGEISGQHRGTHSEGQWWWTARGYTPAGVEAWFGIRALDYLCSRPEVDPTRIGMTGRSGGGSYSWTVAALDERVQVAAPIAGITDLQNQVVDGVVDGHCDCMFYLNTYRWDFPTVAALVAPRPLLIGNSDKDKIFPLDGVVRLHAETRTIYSLYRATDKLGLLITEGPHADTQDLQVPVFRWFNRWLKQENPLVEMAAKKLFTPQQLRVFSELPADSRNANIAESFVPAAATPLEGDTLIATLLEKVFGGWPTEPASLDLKPVLTAETKEAGLRFRSYTFRSQPNLDLSLHLLQDARQDNPERVILKVLDARSFANSPARSLNAGGFPANLPEDLREHLRKERTTVVYFEPRAVDAWIGRPADATKSRRRFLLLGQTLDGMRVWDIRCAVNALKSLPEFGSAQILVQARNEMGVNSAYAALFEPGIAQLELSDLPDSHRVGPDYLNVMKYTDIPHVLGLLSSRLVKPNARSF